MGSVVLSVHKKWTVEQATKTNHRILESKAKINKNQCLPMSMMDLLEAHMVGCSGSSTVAYLEGSILQVE